jgi:NitT/TauT family transport system permease protein
MVAAPHDLIEMSHAYNISTRERIRHIFLPHLGPGIMAAARVGLQLSWKTIVIMEALVRSDGIGSQLELFFKLLRPEDLLAWTFLFAVVMLLVEFGLFRPISRRIFSWRSRAVVA